MYNLLIADLQQTCILDFQVLLYPHTCIVASVSPYCNLYQCNVASLYLIMKLVQIILGNFTGDIFFPKSMLNSSHKVYPQYIFSKAPPTHSISMTHLHEKYPGIQGNPLDLNAYNQSNAHLFWNDSFYVMNEATNRRGACIVDVRWERNHWTIERQGWSLWGRIGEVGWRRM